jgi:folate-binding protein YgfZ
MSQRQILRCSGPDVHDFLQGLVTNDLRKLDQGLVYAAMLSPQGKYIADFFMVLDGQDVLLDAPLALAPGLLQRLTMYKLRANVTITAEDLHVHRGLGAIPDDGFADPRHAALGWRAYRTDAQTPDETDWDSLRVAHVIPAYGHELSADSYILEQGFERLNGVDFRKGCYVGQEVTARMKHKTELRKGLARVQVDGPAMGGTEITINGKPVGTLHTRSGDAALAYLRFDRAGPGMMAGDARISLVE